MVADALASTGPHTGKPHDGHAAGSTLADDLRELAERDPGRDVFAVVGLTSSLSLVSATFEQLGFASVGGRHLIVRGYADLEERKLYADAFRDLMTEERELALDARRQHKTAVVLLHEIAHTLGAEHEADDKLLKAVFGEAPDTSITIKEDRKVPVGSVGDLIDRAKAIGFTRFRMGWADE